MNTRRTLSPELAAFQGSSRSGSREDKVWRTLEELADSAAFRQLMQRVGFPAQADAWPDALAWAGATS